MIRARPDVRFYVRASRIGSAALRCAPTRSFASTGPTPLSNWPGDLRRVTLYDADNCRRLIFWSNLWSAPASIIAKAYRQSWQGELFFQWLKHGLRIQTFYGTSDNAVRLQLWASICVYLAMATARYQLSITTNLTPFEQILSPHAPSKAPIMEVFANFYTRNRRASKISV